MKKFIITFVLFISFTSSVFAEEQKELIAEGIKSYKNGNYLGTIQTMEEVVKENPGSILAYYYMAISYVQVGKADKARNAYEKVIFLNPNSQLASYAELGIERLDPEMHRAVENSEKDFLQNFQNDFYAKDVEEDIKQRKLKYIIDKINNHQQLAPDDYNNFKDFTPDKSSKPTPEEIAQAYKVLAKAGLNPQSNYGVNPEMMKNSMMLGSIGGMPSGGNNAMNMMPLIMMMQNQQGQNNIDPDFMQSMISNMMMPDMMSLYGDNKNY